MFTITIKRENNNGQEFGYGVYVNAYVTLDEFENDVPKLYASEYVPFAHSTKRSLAAAGRRVRRNAEARIKREIG